jgi:hypothetical protein
MKGGKLADDVERGVAKRQSLSPPLKDGTRGRGVIPGGLLDKLAHWFDSTDVQMRQRFFERTEA